MPTDRLTRLAWVLTAAVLAIGVAGLVWRLAGVVLNTEF